MQKYILITDLHITKPGDTIIGLDPEARFRRVLSHALAHHADADRLILLGDLTHHGTPEEYERLRPILEGSPVPLTLTVGNHDIRFAMAETLGHEHLTNGFAQHAWRKNGTLFLLLDTVDEDGHAPQHGGWLCADRLGWIGDQIASHPPDRIVAMMHHPPVATGLPGVDHIGLSNGTDLIDLFAGAQVPTQLICGHVHRTISGMARGMPFTILKSPCHQMPLDLSTANSGLSVDEPGAYGVLLVDRDQVIVHTQDVFDTPPHVATDAAST